MNHIFDQQRAILLDEPEPSPYSVTEYIALERALAEGMLHPDEPHLIAPMGDTAILLPMLPMVYHHVAQGTINDIPWMAAFCCLCNAGTVFDPRHDGTVYTFAAQGYYDVMVLIADQQTHSYWNHLTGVCMHGAMTGVSLERLSGLSQVRSGEALVAYPHAQIAVMDGMSEDEKVTAERWNQVYRLPENPSYGNELLGTGSAVDGRLPRHDIGLGVWTGQTSRYYPILRLYDHHNVIIDQLDGQTLVVFLDESVGLPVAFYYDVRPEQVKMRGHDLVLGANANYHKGLLVVDGAAVKIERPYQNAIRWYGFSSIFPKCEIYG